MILWPGSRQCSAQSPGLQVRSDRRYSVDKDMRLDIGATVTILSTVGTNLTATFSTVANKL
jgi:hypothetical protein